MTCPCYGWSDGLDGALRTTLHLGCYRKSFGLQQVRATERPDWFPADVDGKALLFEDEVAPTVQRVLDRGFRAESHDLNSPRHSGTIEFGESGLYHLAPAHVPLMVPVLGGGALILGGLWMRSAQ